MILKQCKGVHCVDLGESFHTHMFLQNLASIQLRTSPVKFARSPRTDPPDYRLPVSGRGTIGGSGEEVREWLPFGLVTR